MAPSSRTMAWEPDLLRVTTSGSVDDGKSTLLGRLLYDLRAVPDDAIEAMQRASRRAGRDRPDLSLLTDGLLAEREQGITIDVAYRYLATPRRKFIIADVPGHEQYTRNMVTGASTADLALILIDARKGLTRQSRRHACLCGLLGIRQILFAVNKMDLAGFAEETFKSIRVEVAALSARLGLPAPLLVPVSALDGENVVRRGASMPWYNGPTLIEVLEQAEATDHDRNGPFRLPVQLVSRIDDDRLRDFRGYIGRIESGIVRPGDAIVVQPSGQTARIATVMIDGVPVDAAGAPDSVMLTLDREIDITRGDLIAGAEDPGHTAKEVSATLYWFGTTPSPGQRKYLLRHTTRSVSTLISVVESRIDLDTLANVWAESLENNEIGRVRLRLQSPIAYDPYTKCRATGSFILIDPDNNKTVAAGVIA